MSEKTRRAQLDNEDRGGLQQVFVFLLRAFELGTV